MADKAISSLTAATAINEVDLFVLEQDGVAKKLTGATLTNFISHNIMDVSLLELPAGSSPTATFYTATGILELGIPNGNSITNVTIDGTGHIIFHYADGTDQTFDTVKGDPGKSAYEAAVEAGYEGSETDYNNAQRDLGQAATNEAARVAAEAARASRWNTLLGQINAKINAMQSIIQSTVAYYDSQTQTLIFYPAPEDAEGAEVIGTTLYM